MNAPRDNAGLQALVGAGWIGPIHCAGREIIRRLFVTVRDRNWQEIPPTRFRSISDNSRGTVTLGARHTSDLVDFEWTGELAVSEDRAKLRFTITGRALRDMDVCRLGLIVLHPVAAMVGANLTALTDTGQQQLAISERLAPQPIINDLPVAMTEPFRALSIDREDFGTLQLSFSGDLFELEDQRNWGDATFKTYCTPLRRGFPRKVAAGTTIEHAVEANFQPSSQSPTTQSRKPDRAIALPAIGRVWNPGRPRDEARGWDHVHLDLSTIALESPEAAVATLQQALDAAPDSAFELAFDTKADPATTSLASLLGTNRYRIARVLLYGLGTAAPEPAALAWWNTVLNRESRRVIPVFAAVRGYFVEFNRARGAAISMAGIAFPLTATVHSDDVETLMSNVTTIRHMATSARELFGQPEIALAPLALYHPPRRESLQRLPDERVAQWLEAALSNIVTAGVTSVTLADDVLRAFKATPAAEQAQAARALLRAAQH